MGGRAAVLESADRADSNSAVREDVWVRVPPAVPLDIDASVRKPRAFPCLGDRPYGVAYAYLLGLYLGDGCLPEGPRGVWHLRLTLDSRYPGIIERALGPRSPRYVA